MELLVKRINVLNLMILLTVLWLTVLATACGSAPATPTPASTATAPVSTPAVNATDQAAGAPATGSVQDLTVEDVVKIVTQRTPVPTPTPGPVDRIVEQIAAESGLAGRSFLGLKTKDWINLGVSALVVLIGSLLVIPLLFGLLNWAVRRTTTQFDDDFLATIRRELHWLVVIILAGLAAFRLEFLSDRLRILLDDLLFLLASGVLYIIALRLITFAADRYLDRLKSEADRKRWAPITLSLERLGYIFVTLIGLSIATSHFGLDVTLPSVILVFVATVIAIAARAAIDDAVSGFLILLDQPFRVGDGILIKELNAWGDVVEIGIRSTRIHLKDNRQVIIPNSLIGKSQVVNYTYPDPAFRVQIDIGVAYGTDFDLMRQVIEETVRGVEGVLPEKPVDVFFLALGDSALQIRVQWWIDTVNNRNLMLTRVNIGLQHALDEAGIELPYKTRSMPKESRGK